MYFYLKMLIKLKFMKSKLKLIMFMNALFKELQVLIIS